MMNTQYFLRDIFLKCFNTSYNYESMTDWVHQKTSMTRSYFLKRFLKQLEWRVNLSLIDCIQDNLLIILYFDDNDCEIFK